ARVAHAAVVGEERLVRARVGEIVRAAVRGAVRVGNESHGAGLLLLRVVLRRRHTARRASHHANLSLRHRPELSMKIAFVWLCASFWKRWTGAPRAFLSGFPAASRRTGFSAGVGVPTAW